MPYAIHSSVPIDRSQGELRKILAKHKATGFAFGEQKNHHLVLFEMEHRRFKFTLPMPSHPSDGATQASIRTYEQVCRTRWRCLVLAVKAKLEAVETGITSLEQEFMAHIVLPGGATVGEKMLPQIETSYRTGKMPPLLGYSS